MSIPLSDTDEFLFTELANIGLLGVEEATVRDEAFDHPNAKDIYDTDEFSPVYGTDTWPHAFQIDTDSATISESGTIEATASDSGTVSESVGDMSLAATEGTE
jgi:hypothetical protein